ncbi:MAG: PD-(D/E)XK nuclease family protein [Candidatus Magasanikbacteria bacterium]|nr:PD-(D/E)XK nuclease family protein [Candidatus Magasanikbacteria bacterium]
MPDKYTATWVSHSSISDFLSCPRAYYLRNVYRDPKTNHKIKRMSPALALGQAVHDTLESLSVLKKEERFDKPLMDRFNEVWEDISGKKGGFTDENQESAYKKRGQTMMTRVYHHPGPLKRLAVKINKELPYFWLSEEENIILCGRVDWLEYLPDTKGVHIIDFKTGKSEESEFSLQLPIYYLLVDRCQKHKVEKASYWYLEFQDELTEKELPDLNQAYERVLKIARDVKLARQLERFKCPKAEDGCFACLPMERILRGEGEYIGIDGFGYDTYILPELIESEDEDSVIL